MYIITVAMQKGGVCKTTTALALAHIASKDNKRVLYIDLDPQGSGSYVLEGDPNKGNSLLLLEGKEVKPQRAQGIDFIPAVWDLTTVKTEPGSMSRLADALQQYERFYDLVVIDTPPDTGELEYEGIYASDLVIIPMKCEVMDARALSRILHTLKQFEQINSNMKKAVVLTALDTRALVVRSMYESINESTKKLGIPVLGSVRRGVAIMEAQLFHKNILDYAPKAKPVQDYVKIYDQIKKEIK